MRRAVNCLFCDDTRVPHCPAESGPTAVLLTDRCPSVR